MKNDIISIVTISDIDVDIYQKQFLTYDNVFNKFESFLGDFELIPFLKSRIKRNTIIVFESNDIYLKTILIKEFENNLCRTSFRGEKNIISKNGYLITKSNFDRLEYKPNNSEKLQLGSFKELLILNQLYNEK